MDPTQRLLFELLDAIWSVRIDPVRELVAQHIANNPAFMGYSEEECSDPRAQREALEEYVESHFQCCGEDLTDEEREVMITILKRLTEDSDNI